MYHNSPLECDVCNLAPVTKILTDFQEIWYERNAIGIHVKAVP
jgi:hypothetical protein